MKSLFLASALLAVAAMADDRVRDVQGELKNQGFFYGAVDGKAGAETSAAIRRFQIRNGLQVTGALNDETLNALGMGGGKSAPPPENITPPPAKPEPATPATPPAPKEPTETPKKKSSDQLNPPAPGEYRPAPPVERQPPMTPRSRDLLRPSDRDDADARPLKPRIVPEDPNVVPPPRGVPAPTLDDWSTFYHGTPYATAPREVQIDVLRKAQGMLASKRVYRGTADGLPGPATVEALFLYQEQRHLGRSGRLDLATLSDLSLLPGRGPEAPPLKPFYNPNRRRDPGVDYNGVIR